MKNCLKGQNLYEHLAVVIVKLELGTDLVTFYERVGKRSDNRVPTIIHGSYCNVQTGFLCDAFTIHVYSQPQK